jgi:hypothetical protein
MRSSPASIASAVVDGSPDHQMPEPHPVAGHLDQLSLFRRSLSGIRINPSLGCCLPHPAPVTGGVGGDHQRELLRIGQQSLHPAQITLLQLTAHWNRLGQIDTGGQFLGCEVRTDLHQRQRVALCVGDYPVHHRRVQRSCCDRAQQLRGRIIGQASNVDQGKLLER